MAFPPLLFNIVLEVLATILDKKRCRINSQDGGVGRYTVPPRTTKIRTTNLKTKNNQNCQKIKLYASLTTKEIKKKHLPRPVGGAEISSQGREDVQQGSSWRTSQSHICADKPGGTTREQDRPCNPGFQ